MILLPKTPPLLLLTSRDDFKAVSEAKNEGVSGYLLKPVTKKALDEKLQQLAISF